MWTRIVLRPWWARALASAGVYAIYVAAYWWARGLAADPYQLAKHVASIVIFGLLVAAFTSNSHQAYTNALAGLDPAQRSAAVDASFRGPVPVDVPVRDAAIWVAGRRLQSARIWRVMWLVLLCLGVLSFVLAWIGRGSLGKLMTGIIFAVILCLTVAAWYVSLSVKHRLQTLRQTGDSDEKSMGEAR